MAAPERRRGASDPRASLPSYTYTYTYLYVFIIIKSV